MTNNNDYNAGNRQATGGYVAGPQGISQDHGDQGQDVRKDMQNHSAPVGQDAWRSTHNRGAAVPSIGTPIGSMSQPSGKQGAAKQGVAHSNGGSKKRTVLVVLGIVVLALAIWVLVWLFACNGSSLIDPSAQTGQAPYKSQEEIQAELDRTVDEGMFNISIASVIQFEDGTSPGTAYIENVPGNHYLMQVTITDDDTGDVLYESGVLKPNQYIEDITLAKDLEPGTYDTTALFTALDEQTYDEIGTAAAKVTINVLG